MTRLKTALAATYILAQFSVPLFAQQNRCAPREVVVGGLASTFGESRQSVGLGEGGVMIETFASRETGTWSITVTTPNMMTCFIASGGNWEELAEALPPQGKEGHRRVRMGDKS